MGQQNPLLLLTGFVLAVCLLFGGATRQGSASDLLPFMASLPLLVIVVLPAWSVLRQQPLVLVILFGILGVPLIQLMPLPSAIWTALPGREHLQEISATIGAASVWRPISVAPDMTMRAFLALLPPLSIFLAVTSLGERSRNRLIGICALIAVASVFVSTLQVYGGAYSSLYFFEFTNIGKGVGFFANANHQAAFLYAVIPLTAAVLTKPDLHLPVHPLVLLVCICSALALGLSMTGSRTAILLGLVSIGYVFWQVRLAISDMPRRYFAWLAAGLVAVLVPLAGGVGLLAILRRFEDQNVLEDARWAVATETWRAAKAYFPFGSGIGTFVPVYQTQESPQNLMFQEVNRAHNDWLETFLEGGFLSAFLIGLFLVWLASKIIVPIRQEDKRPTGLEVAASLAVILICMHAFWDYPLRTTAVSAIFALCLGLMLPARVTQGATMYGR